MNIFRLMALVACNLINSYCCSITSTPFFSSSSSKFESMAQLLEQITKLLLRGYQEQVSVQKNNDLVLLAEILDSLIDIYSDDNQLSLWVAKRIGLLDTLKEYEKQFKNEVIDNLNIKNFDNPFYLD